MELNSFTNQFGECDNFLSSPVKANLFDSFEDYLNNLDSCLKFESPDKWLNILKEDNPNENIFLDTEGDSDAENKISLSSLMSQDPETLSPADNMSSDDSQNTDLVSVPSIDAINSSQTRSEHMTNNLTEDVFESEYKRGQPNKRKRRLTCEEFISHLKHTRDSISMNCRKITEDKMEKESSDECDKEHEAKDLSKLEKKRLKVVEEILATEKTYFRHLELIIELFMAPLQNLQILPNKVITMIFGNIQLIVALNKELSSHFSNKSVVEAFVLMAPFLKLYSAYAQNHERALATLLEWDQRSPEFSKFRRSQEEEPEMKGLKLNALLITPVQRIPRYKLLLEELLSCTSPDHEDYMTLKASAKEIASVANHINEHIRQQDNFMKMFAIQKSLSRSSGVRIVIPGRTFIKEGILKKVSYDGKKYHERIFFLFSDVLIYAKPRLLDSTASNGQYNSMSCCCTLPLHHCSVDRVLGDNREQGSLFSIRCKNEFLLLFSDQNAVSDWISALKKQIDEVRLNRQTLRKKSSAAQPMRQERFLSLFKKKTTPQNTPEKNIKNRLTPTFSKPVTPVNSPRSLKSRKEPGTPSKMFGTGLACIRKNKKKIFSEVYVPEKPKVFKDFSIIEESNIFAGQNNITLNDSLENILYVAKPKENINNVIPMIFESDEQSSTSGFRDSRILDNSANESCDLHFNEKLFGHSNALSAISLSPSTNQEDFEPFSPSTSSPYKHVTLRKTPGSKNKREYFQDGTLLRNPAFKSNLF